MPAALDSLVHAVRRLAHTQLKTFTMKLVLLGTTGYHPSDRSHTLCMVIPECGIMLDAGTVSSKGEAGRLIRQKAVEMDGVRVTNDQDLDLSEAGSLVLRVGKRRFVRIIVGGN